MKNLTIRKEVIFWFLIIIPFIYIVYIWNLLPQTIVTHFDINGNPDGHGSKLTILIMPGVNIFMYLLLLAIPFIDPKRMNYESFGNIFYKMRLLLTVFFTALSLYITSISVHGTMHDTGHWLISAVFLFLALIGNFLINIKPNWFIGIRTPWTLSSDTVWKKTHLVGGRLWFYGGIICFLLSLLIRAKWLYAIMFGFIFCSAIFLVVYSYMIFKKEKKEMPAPNS